MPEPVHPLPSDHHLSMKVVMRTFEKLAMLGVSLLLVAGFAASASAKKNELPQTTEDGMELVKHTEMRAVYRMPDASLEPYSKVILLDCYVAFEKHWQRNYNRQELSLQSRITDKDMEQMKSVVAEEFVEEFTKVLNKRGHEVVTDAAEDVLILRPAIINLEVTAPGKVTAGRSREFVSSAGAMTLYMEVYDSVSGAKLGKVLDPRASTLAGGQIANKTTNIAAADRQLRQWAEILADHLGALKDS